MSGEGIAEVLAAHESTESGCTCGGDCGWTHGDWQAHVAAALLASPALADLLAAERQRGREEALREAAKEAEERGDIGKDGGCEAWTWLRIRADRIADVPAAAEGERE